MKKTAILLAILCLLGMFAGCQSKPQESGDSMTFISYKKSENFDPLLGAGADFIVGHALLGSLVEYGPNGEIIPCVAERWEEAPDQTYTTFYLRKDVKFHNGTPLTADDIIYSLDVTMSSPLYSWLREDAIIDYEKVDDYTVILHKAAPYVPLMENLIEFGFILPKEYHSADPAAFDKAPIGCGPYKFVSLEADNSVKLEAFEDYFGDTPGFKYVTVKPPLEDASVVIALETGEADVATQLPAIQAALVEANKDLTLVTVSDSWGINLVLLMGEPLSSDQNLRKAIFHGINRESAIKLGNEGIGTPATDLFSKRIMGEFAGKIDFVGYDEALAKEYLAKSGYNGETLTLTLNQNPALAESILSDLGKLGINVAIEQLDTNDYYTKMYDGNTQLTMATMGSDVMNIVGFMHMFSSYYEYYGGLMTKSDKFDSLITRIQESTDIQERNDLTIQAQQEMYDMATIVPLFDAVSNYSYGPNVTYDYPISAPTLVFYLNRIMPR